MEKFLFCASEHFWSLSKPHRIYFFIYCFISKLRFLYQCLCYSHEFHQTWFRRLADNDQVSKMSINCKGVWIPVSFFFNYKFIEIKFFLILSFFRHGQFFDFVPIWIGGIIADITTQRLNCLLKHGPFTNHNFCNPSGSNATDLTNELRHYGTKCILTICQ